MMAMAALPEPYLIWHWHERTVSQIDSIASPPKLNQNGKIITNNSKNSNAARLKSPVGSNGF
jgi:hypothetical protein